MRFNHFYFILFLSLSFVSCKKNESSFSSHYETKSGSAFYYFNKGWVAIMDHGKWMDSERFYRKAVTLDSNFAIAKSLVGRITGNLYERIALEKELSKKLNTLKEHDQLLLEVYLASIHSMNQRGQGLKVTPEQTANRFKKAEFNFHKFIKKYPEDNYVKAEYIEILHRLYGPKTALDSLYFLASEAQLKIPFYIFYKGTLESEMGNFERALKIADELKESLNNPTLPNQYLLLADIYYQMDSLKLAKFMIEKVVSLDPKHLIGQGLQKKIYEKIDH